MGKPKEKTFWGEVVDAISIGIVPCLICVGFYKYDYETKKKENQMQLQNLIQACEQTLTHYDEASTEDTPKKCWEAFDIESLRKAVEEAKKPVTERPSAKVLPAFGIGGIGMQKV